MISEKYKVFCEPVVVGVGCGVVVGSVVGESDVVSMDPWVVVTAGGHT